MGVKEPKGQPTLSAGDRQSAEGLCERLREIVERRDSMVRAIKDSPDQVHERAQRHLDALDAALAAIKPTVLKRAERALEREVEVRTYWAVEATVELLIENRTCATSPQTLQEAAENCEVSVEKMQDAILNRGVQDILEQGLGPQKAAFKVVGLLKGRSASTVFASYKKHCDDRALWQEQAKMARVAKVQLKSMK